MRRYQIVINGILKAAHAQARREVQQMRDAEWQATQKKAAADYDFVDLTIWYSDMDDIDEEIIVNRILSEYERRGLKLIRSTEQSRAGLDKIQLVGSVVEEEDDLQYHLNEGILEEEPAFVRDERGRFASKTDYYRELRLNSYKSLSDLLDEDY